MKIILALLMTLLISGYVLMSVNLQSEKEYEVDVKELEGNWSGTAGCLIGEMNITGEWRFGIAGKEVEGSVSIPGLVDGILTGTIEDNKLVATITYSLLGVEGKIDWVGEINETIINGTTEIELLGKTAECSWSGQKIQVTIHYGSIQRKTTDGLINLTYIPICIEKCKKIVFIQVIHQKAVFADGSSSYYNPSDSSPDWSYQNNDAVDGHVVDTLNGERDPYYNGDDKGSDNSAGQGEHGSPSKNSTIADRPRVSESEFTNLEKKYSKPVSKVVYEFEVCAFCAEGEDAGKFYGCMAWAYEQEKGKGDAGGKASQPGTTNSNPSEPFEKALAKWSKNHGFNLPKAG